MLENEAGQPGESAPQPPPPHDEPAPQAPGEAAGAESQPPEEAKQAEGGPPSMHDLVVGACRSVYDPEIPVNIYDLGLIYKIDVQPDQHVFVEMTLTSPACPVAGTLPPEVEQRIREVPGVIDAKVDVVWDPPWHPGMMTEDAQLELGFM